MRQLLSRILIPNDKISKKGLKPAISLRQIYDFPYYAQFYFLFKEMSTDLASI